MTTNMYYDRTGKLWVRLDSDVLMPEYQTKIHILIDRQENKIAVSDELLARDYFLFDHTDPEHGRRFAAYYDRSDK